MNRRTALLLVLALALAACGSKDAGKRYFMTGTIKSLDPTMKVATVDAGKIGDWMDAMTMDYQVKPDAEFAKLHVGDKINATVVVKDPTYYITDVSVVQK
ncbi:MAG TPA: copper-binding protein [Candidatus Limnocylindrales bacterium]|nr:copper-binding protein [Candidatus Limnocylindrales bacterium]